MSVQALYGGYYTFDPHGRKAPSIHVLLVVIVGPESGGHYTFDRHKYVAANFSGRVSTTTCWLWDFVFRIQKRPGDTLTFDLRLLAHFFCRKAVRVLIQPQQQRFNGFRALSTCNELFASQTGGEWISLAISSSRLFEAFSCYTELLVRCRLYILRQSGCSNQFGSISPL